MAKDPVCGMEVKPEESAGTAEFNNETYYFCAPGCKNAFEKDPEHFLTPTDNTPHDHHGHHHP